MSFFKKFDLFFLLLLSLFIMCFSACDEIESDDHPLPAEADADVSESDIIREQYVTNSMAGTCNNSMLSGEEREITGRIFYRVKDKNATEYVLRFCNAVDSTYQAGAECQANIPGDRYTVVSAYACAYSGEVKDFSGGSMIPVFFDGQVFREVAPSESYVSDPFVIDLSSADYLVFEWTVRGTDIPFCADKLQPSYIINNGSPRLSPAFPQPVLVCAKRDVRMTLAFLGDSITQGLQTPVDKYDFWAAMIADGLPSDVACANLGLSFARACDAASGGVWFEKAKEFDFVSVCFGVNDLSQGRSVDQLCGDLHTIVFSLKKAGCRVGIFTVPPFGIKEYERDKVNEYIKTELAPLCEYVYDTDAVLEDPEADGFPLWGLHPSVQGCRLLADDFLEKNKYIFEK